MMIKTCVYFLFWTLYSEQILASFFFVIYIHCNTVTEKKRMIYLIAICKENGTILTDEMLHES